MPGHKSISTRSVWGGGKGEEIRGEKEKKVGCGVPSKASAGRKLSAALGEGRLAEDSSQNRLPCRPFSRADLCRLEGSRPGERLPLEALCT